MSQPLVKQLPVWTEKATGKQVWALQVGRLIPCPRGVSIYPKDESYAAFEMPTWWSETTRVAEGDYVVWETGEPVFSWKPAEFEAHFRPAADGKPTIITKGKLFFDGKPLSTLTADSKTDP